MHERHGLPKWWVGGAPYLMIFFDPLPTKIDSPPPWDALPHLEMKPPI